MTDEQFAVLVVLLTDIRDVLVAGIQASEEQVGAECPHPDDQRIDVSTPGDRNHWICNACRFDNKTIPMS
jgi:hypothetical protein